MKKIVISFSLDDFFYSKSTFVGLFNSEVVASLAASKIVINFIFSEEKL